MMGTASILFVTLNAISKNDNGGSLVSNRNLNILQNIFSKEATIRVIDKKNVMYDSVNFRNVFTIIKNVFTLKILLFRNDVFKQIDYLVSSDPIKIIFIDNSLIGYVNKYISKTYPYVKVITYSHNVEYIFSYHRVKIEPNLRNIYYLFSSYYWERISLSKSTVKIGISEIDNIKIHRLYRNNYDFIIPVTLEDILESRKYKVHPNTGHITTLLFVGSNFYANIYGIKWFVRNALPRLNVNLWIAGSGISFLEKEFKSIPKITLFPDVPNLNDLYEKCDVIIAPIFHGSGMKVKVAEAMTYGKPIVGTSISFYGFKNCPGLFKCESSDEFVKCLNDLILNDKNKEYYNQIIQCYQNNYSYKSALDHFNKVYRYIST